MKKYSKDVLRQLYRVMLRIRLCEESFVEPILNGDVRCPCHLYSGEEAIAAGICASLNKTDYIFGNHRSHGHFLAKGGSINELTAEIYCKETGCSRGRGGSMHLIDPDVGMLGAAPIVAGTISLALGAALAASIRKDKRVAVCFFGDGATGEGVLYESLNFAALKKLPIVFVCENNLYATHMPVRECRIENSIYRIAEPFCIESREIDGNDVLKVYEEGQKAIDKCRAGDGPVFLECLTYRFRGHVGPDDNIQGSHTDIRPKEEVEAWFRKDPIKLFENYLSQNKLVDEGALDEIRREVQSEVDDAHIFAKNSPVPDRRELIRDVYI
ncbi:MAG: thiamine pyrophosphate-dependent dehydrogenase E1 component subunit alpha [Thermodesulfobacteriota bacterium]|nr:thiamine pyrophosphate-dependent dehydrogenase E1 component subunit alpha [Thermodesulfobacteriota bacterium]